ncbi:MAG: serine hydrolase [Bdellovibrionota bacterium]
MSNTAKDFKNLSSDISSNISQNNNNVYNQDAYNQDVYNQDAEAQSVLFGKNVSSIISCLEKAVDNNVFPGAVISIVKNYNKEDQFHFIKACGYRLTEEDEWTDKNSAVNETTVYDLGELTLLFCTASLVMKLIKQEKCSVDDLVSRYLQGFSVNGKSLISIKNLLTSQSGLMSSYPFYEEISKNSQGSRIGMLASRGAKEYVLNKIVRSNLKTQPNTKVYYSEVANILLGFIVEVLSGNTLDKAFYKEIAEPLNLTSSGFVDLALLRLKKLSPVLSLIAPTERCDWREKTLCGEVQNDNAWAMGGVAGNAGLFSNVQDVTIFAIEILKALRGESDVFDEHITKEFLGYETEQAPYLWERASKENMMLSCGFSSSAVGINSFTGCSLWIDPKKDLIVALLANRVHPLRSNKKIVPYRVQIFSEAIRLAES